MNLSTTWKGEIHVICESIFQLTAFFSAEKHLKECKCLSICLYVILSVHHDNNITTQLHNQPDYSPPTGQLNFVST